MSFKVVFLTSKANLIKENIYQILILYYFDLKRHI